MNKIIWEIPLKTVSEANCSEHWTVKSKRHRRQQYFVRQLFAKERTEIALPCVVLMTRLSNHELDDDNLPVSFKYIRDEIGACIFPEKVVTYISKHGKVKQNKGHSDSDPRIKWRYGQEKAKIQGIRIEIEWQDCKCVSQESPTENLDP